MGAPSGYFVDPDAGTDDTVGDRGSVIGNPWKSVQFAMDNITRDATNGDQVNLKAGTADTLTTKLVLTTYGNPSQAAPFILRGYTSIVDDGGIGDINGDGSSVFNTSSKNAFHVIDMVMHNCGSNQIFRAGSDCLILRSEFHKATSSSSALQAGTRSSVIDCYVHDFTANGIVVTSGSISYCFVDKSITNNNTGAIQTSLQSLIHHNIIKLSGSANTATGIRINNGGTFAFNNSIWSNAGSGVGIFVTTNLNGGEVSNNLIDGLSASGGIGIDTKVSARFTVFFNSVNDCATAFDLTHDEHGPYGNNETLSATPFTDATNNDFTPVDTGDVLAGFTTQFPGPSGTPTSFAARGAVESECVAGGGSGGFFKSSTPLGF